MNVAVAREWSYPASFTTKFQLCLGLVYFLRYSAY